MLAQGGTASSSHHRATACPSASGRPFTNLQPARRLHGSSLRARGSSDEVDKAAAASRPAEPDARPKVQQMLDEGTQRLLNLPYQSETDKMAVLQQVVKTTGLHRAPLSGGVKSATLRYDLPSPPVAVRNLVEIAHYGHLCTTMSGMHHRRAGYPFGTVIDFAADGAGYPLFCLSPLAIHSRNLLQDPRSSLVVQMPGWTGLANARVTIFGDTYQLPTEMQAAAQQIFSEKHGGEERWLSGNFVYYRMSRIIDIYFVGGFGTVQWITADEYLSSRPDDIVLDKPIRMLQLMTQAYAAELVGPMTAKLGEPVTEVQFVSLDANGADIRVRTAHDFNVQRIGFPSKVHTQEEAMSGLQAAVATMKRMSEPGATTPASS